MNVFDFAAGHPGFAFLLALIAATVIAHCVSLALEVLNNALRMFAVCLRGWPSTAATPRPDPTPTPEPETAASPEETTA